MSVPTLAGLTTIDRADNNTNWSGWGQNSGKWGTSSDFVKEGTASNALAPFQTGDGGWGYDSVGGIDLSANLLMMWVNVGSPAFVATFGSTPAGVYIRITTGASWTTEYSDYYVGGSDVAWVGRGWHLVVLDANRTRDRGTGTTTLTNINRVGLGLNITATASKSDIIMIDHMFYGTSMEVTGPSFTDGTNGIDINSGGTIDRNDGGSFVTDGWEVGDYVKIDGSATAANDGVYELTAVAATLLTTGESFTQDTANTTLSIYASVTLEDIYQKDGVTDDDWYSPVDKPPDGGYVLNYPLTIGDVSGALDCFFLSRGEVVIFADQPMSTTGEDYLATAEDTGETHVQVGLSTGTGDDRTGFGGSVFVGQETIFSLPTPRGVDFDVNITEFELYGVTFLDIDWDLTFATSTTAHYVTNVNFIQCGQVSLGDVEARNLQFVGHDGPDVGQTGALLWQKGETDIKNSQFLANDSDISGSPYAAGIQHDVFGSFTYDGLTFAGNEYDVLNTESPATSGQFGGNDSDFDLYSGGTGATAGEGVGQSWLTTGSSQELCVLFIDLQKVGSPTGNIVAKVYSHSGTYGTSSVPGTLLATSNVIDVSTLGTSWTEESFTFTDGENITLSASTHYVVTLEYTGGDSSNRVEVARDSGGSHAGNMSRYPSGGPWAAEATPDLADWLIGVDGLVTISATNDADPATYYNSANTPGVTDINNAVILTVTVQEADGTKIQDVEVGIYNNTTRALIHTGTTNASGVTQKTDYNYTGDVEVYIRVRKSTSGTRYNFEEARGTIESGGMSVTVTLSEDEIAS